MCGTSTVLERKLAIMYILNMLTSVGNNLDNHGALTLFHYV